MSPLKLKSNKLFYSKWPYKISCVIKGAWIIRALKFNIDNEKNIINNIYIQRNNVNVDELINFLNRTKDFLKNENVKIRIHSSCIDFYFLTKAESDNFITVSQKYISCITEPENDNHLKFLLENQDYNICNKLPHGKYKFKVIFKDMPDSVRTQLISWAEKYSNDDIYIIKSTRNHFKSLKHHYGTHYFYVKDRPMITMINLIAGGYVSKTEEFRTKNSINNVSN